MNSLFKRVVYAHTNFIQYRIETYNCASMHNSIFEIR